MPSAILNMDGNRTSQPSLAAGQYCRALPSMAAAVGIRAASVAEWRNDAPGQVRSCTQRNMRNFCAAAPIRRAPLCPLQDNTLLSGCWYPDEDICKARRFQTLDWLKKQKKIVKLGLNADAGYFTVSMLQTLTIMRKGLNGADADDYPASENRWLKDHTKKTLPSTPQETDRGKAVKADKRGEPALVK